MNNARAPGALTGSDQWVAHLDECLWLARRRVPGREHTPLVWVYRTVRLPSCCVEASGCDLVELLPELGGMTNPESMT